MDGAWAGCGAHSESTSSIALPPPRQPPVVDQSSWQPAIVDGQCTSACPVCFPFLMPPSAALPSAPVCRESARACMRNGGRGVARTAETTSTTLAAAAPSALVAWPKTIDVPLSSPKRQKTRRRRAARARRAAPAVARPYRHLGPSEQPSRRPPTAPVVGLDRFCIAIL